MRSSTLQEAEEKIEDMNKRLELKGRKPIRYGIVGRIFMNKTDEGAKKHVEKLLSQNPELLRSVLDRDFVGSPDIIATRIRKLSSLGFDYVIFQATPALRILREMENSLLPIT